MQFTLLLLSSTAFSALMLLGSRKGIQPVKNWAVECRRSHLSGARCRLAYGPDDATATHYASVKSRLVLPFWYRLTWVGPDKGSVNVRACVCITFSNCWHCLHSVQWRVNVCPSVPSDHHILLQQVCCCGPSSQEISTTCCTAGGQQQPQCSSQMRAVPHYQLT